MPRQAAVFLDIETTGFAPSCAHITVLGICSAQKGLVQLVGNEITRKAIFKAMPEGGILYTYNGRRFDLPFIEDAVGLDLERYFDHKIGRASCRERV